MPVTTTPEKDCYKDFEELCQRVSNLKLPPNWNIEFGTNLHIFKNDEIHEIPIFDLFFNNDLNFIIRVFTWCLPTDHEIYKRYKNSVKKIFVSNLVKEIMQYHVCQGMKNENTFQYSDQHIIPKKCDPFKITTKSAETKFYRGPSCTILSTTQFCTNCIKFESKKIAQFTKLTKKQNATNAIPAKPKAPISKLSTERLKSTLQHYRIENKLLKSEIEELKLAIEKSSMSVSAELSKDMISIMSAADQSKVSPFMKLFWDEQQKYLKSSSTGVRYHPMIIRYCLSLASKSSAAYDEIRYDEKKGTGFLILPSRRRLRDYKNYIKPKRGFNPEIIEELRKKTKDFSENEKFVAIIMDEMKIQENLVWDKHSGELIGYVDLGDPDLHYATLPDTNAIASHILVFLVRSIVNPFKFSLANFATKDVSATQIFPLFWKAVGICEINMLKVVAVTCDGAAPNRLFFKLHFHLIEEDDMNPDVDVVYKTRNLHSLNEKRFIYFISDVPHLLKTVRNCLFNSGSGKHTRYMWNNGKFLLWHHIADFFNEEQELGLHYLPKITYEHIRLTPYSIMNVKLAAQVLSTTVSNVIRKYGPDSASETARYCLLMDTFFDMMNIRDINSNKYDQKPSLKPFSSIDDPRFSWLQNVFLQYFEDWRISIENRNSNYTKKEKNKMFISRETYEGLKISVNSIIELIKFLLQHQIKYVLTARFNQDCLENYFGRQRSSGARKDNPSVQDFGFNDNAIRNQKVFRPISGNVRGIDETRIEFSDEMVPCRKRSKPN